MTVAAILCVFAVLGRAASAPARVARTGRVVAESTLDPVAGAQASIETLAGPAVMDNVAAVTTDRDGRFRIDAATGARLRLSAPGFFDGFVELTDADPDLGTLVLREELSLRGRLVQGGEPVAGARLFAEGADDLPSPAAVSDADGYFRIGGIDPDRLSGLVVVWSDVVETIDLGYANTPLEPRAYDLGEIVLPTPVRVRGRVVSEAGVPVSDAIIWLEPDDRVASTLQRVRRLDAAALPPPFVRSAGDGLFSIAALRGRYRVRVVAGRPPLQRIIDVHDTTDVGTLVLPEPASTGGLVLDARGDPLPGVRIRVEWVTDAISMPVEGMAVAEVTSGPDGCYRLPVVAPGDSGWIQVSRPGYATARVRIAPATSPPSSAACNDLEPIRLADVGALRGFVRGENGAPLPGATVVAIRLQTARRPWQPLGPSVESDRNGEFVLQDLEVGDYELHASAPGHRGVTMNGPAVRAGAIEVVELTLDSPGTKHPLRIQVLDHRGIPVPDAAVGVSRVQSDRNDQPLPKVHTGADGRVRFDGVAAGSYHVGVSTRVEGLRYGNSVRLDDALPEVVLHAPAPTTPLAALAGRIVDAAGEGVSGMVVTFEDLAARSFRSLRTFSERDGSFRLPAVPAGEYGVSAQRRGIAPILLEDALVHPASGTDDLLLRVPPSSTISGRIVGLTGDDLIGTTLDARREILLGEGGVNASAVGHVHLDGAFTIGELSPGEWSIRAGAPNGRRVRTTVDIARPGASLTTTITLAEGLLLSGVVTYRDRPVAGRLDIHGMDSGERRFLQLGPDGSFAARGLQPGRYRVWVRNAPAELFTEQIDLRGDRHVEIQVRGAAVAGTAVDAVTGQPVAGAHLRANPQPKWVWDAHHESHRTGSDGIFAAGPFGAGSWKFDFSAPGYATERLRLDLDDDDVTNVRLLMRPTPGLTLRITLPSGSLPGRMSLIWRDDSTGESYQHSASPSHAEPLSNWPDVALGPGLLTVIMHRPRYAARLAIDNDGTPVEVVLEPGGGMILTVPDLMQDTAEATLRLIDAEGRPVQGQPENNSWKLSPDREFFEQVLPAGTYEAVVEAADGRVWRGRIEIVAGKMNRVELR